MQERQQLNAQPNNFSIPFIEDKIDLRSLLFIFYAEKWLILGITLVSLFFGVLYAINLVPQYQANVLLQVESKSSGDLLSPGKMLGGALGNQTSPADIQIALIKSRFILMPVVESLGLDITNEPHYFPLIGAWYARNHNTELTKPFLGLSQYAWGGQSLQITKMSTTNEIGKNFKLVAGLQHSYKIYDSSGQLVLEGKEGVLAHAKKNSNSDLSILVKSLIANPGTEFKLSKLATDNIANKIALQLQISDLGQLYQIDKTGVLQLSLTNSNPQYIVELLNKIANFALQKDIERKTVEAEKTLNFLDEQIPVVKASLSVAEKALNHYRMQSGTIDVTLKSRLIINQLSAVQKEIEKNNLTHIMQSQLLTPEHPFIQILNSKKHALEVELLDLEKQLQKLPASDQIAVGLIRDIKVKTQLYLLLLHKIQELKVSKAGTVSDLRILSLASAPSAPLPLGRGLVILASALLGFILGALLVFMRKAFHRVVDDPNWLEQHFGIPTFAIVPFSKVQNDNIMAYNKKLRRDLPLLARTLPHDLAIESLRSLRTSLQFALLGAKNNIIAVMGISPGIGKSFVTANFSYILADSNKRVLLIDGDIRKGYLHSYFETTQVPGLSEAICGQAQLANVIRKTSLPNLDFIPAGKFPPNPSELLISQEFKEMLAKFSAEYDLVIIDTAPVLAVTDGVVIGKQTGLNFLLYASNKHQAEEIELTIKRLENSGVVVQGAIFNNLSASSQAKGRYNYHYAYGETEKV